MQKISKPVATLFFIGYTPLAPGTLASLLAVGVYLIVRNNLSLYLFCTLFFLILGFWASSRAEGEFDRKDPQQIVIDEFASTMIVYIFIPFGIKFLVTGFLLYRIFDIFKIPPIKKIETLPGGYGQMPGGGA